MGLPDGGGGEADRGYGEEGGELAARHPGRPQLFCMYSFKFEDKRPDLVRKMVAIDVGGAIKAATALPVSIPRARAPRL